MVQQSDNFISLQLCKMRVESQTWGCRVGSRHASSDGPNEAGRQDVPIILSRGRPLCNQCGFFGPRTFDFFIDDSFYHDIFRVSRIAVVKKCRKDVLCGNETSIESERDGGRGHLVFYGVRRKTYIFETMIKSSCFTVESAYRNLQIGIESLVRPTTESGVLM